MRRSTLKEHRQKIARLQRKLRKEEKRAQKVLALKQTIYELESRIRGYQNDPDLR